MYMYYVANEGNDGETLAATFSQFAKAWKQKAHPRNFLIWVYVFVLGIAYTRA